MSELMEPVWLKVMQNGSAGEARTKAFLIDRFWVLERSVDIDGADFLVQPRGLANRFTDRSPPKVGVVQAKYFQDRRTTHHIPSHYVTDEEGAPLRGFFAVLHVGAEDDAEMYLLSASDIVSTLDLTTEQPSRYIVGAKALADRFKVSRRRQSLDRIANDIHLRTSAQSLAFFDRVNIPFRPVSKADIEYNYTLPIPNGQADIPQTYYDYRQRLRSLLYEIEEGIELIDTILQTPDPRSALQTLEKLKDYRVTSSSYDGLQFTARVDLDWPYFEEALDEHDKARAALEAADKLSAFVDLSNRAEKQALSTVAPLAGKFANDTYVRMQLDYDPASLAFRSLTAELLTREDDRRCAANQAVQPIWFHNGKPQKHDEVARNLWHGLMKRVLEEVCPELVETED